MQKREADGLHAACAFIVSTPPCRSSGLVGFGLLPGHVSVSPPAHPPYRANPILSSSPYLESSRCRPHPAGLGGVTIDGRLMHTPLTNKRQGPMHALGYPPGSWVHDKESCTRNKAHVTQTLEFVGDRHRRCGEWTQKLTKDHRGVERRTFNSRCSSPRPVAQSSSMSITIRQLSRAVRRWCARPCPLCPHSRRLGARRPEHAPFGHPARGHLITVHA